METGSKLQNVCSWPEAAKNSLWEPRNLRRFWADSPAGPITARFTDNIMRIGLNYQFH
jgi:hypothetical protein